MLGPGERPGHCCRKRKPRVARRERGPSQFGVGDTTRSERPESGDGLAALGDGTLTTTPGMAKADIGTRSGPARSAGWRLRNWRLRTRELLAVLLIPTVCALVLGGLRVRSDLQAARRSSTTSRTRSDLVRQAVEVRRVARRSVLTRRPPRASAATVGISRTAVSLVGTASCAAASPPCGSVPTRAAVGPVLAVAPVARSQFHHSAQPVRHPFRAFRSAVESPRLTGWDLSHDGPPWASSSGSSVPGLSPADRSMDSNRAELQHRSSGAG